MLPSNETYFQTADKSLTCEIMGEKMILQAKLLKSRILFGFHIIVSVILFIVAWMLLFLEIYDNDSIGFDITYTKILVGFLFIILSILFDLMLVKLIFSINRLNRTFNQVAYLRSLSAVLILIVPFIATISIFSSIRFYFIQSFVFFLVSLFHYIIFNIYRKETITINIERKENTYEITAIQEIPLIPFEVNRFNFTQIMFERTVNEFYVAILPFSQSSRTLKMQFKNKILFHYSWLSLEEAKSHLNLTNQFICYLVDKKTDFFTNFGTMIGVKYPIEYIQQLIDFVNPFAPMSIIKPENKSESEFVNYVMEHSSQKNKRSDTILWGISIVFAIILIFSSLFAMIFILYAIIIINSILMRVFLGIGLIIPMITIYAPFRIWKVVKKTREDEQNSIKRFSLAKQ